MTSNKVLLWFMLMVLADLIALYEIVKTAVMKARR